MPRAEEHPEPVSLAEVVAQGPIPSWRALELVLDLARNAMFAHTHGQVTGCADLSRLIVVESAGLRLVPGPPPVDTTVDDDVRGLGAVLYALVTGYWPLALDPQPSTEDVSNSGELARLTAAPRDDRGVLLAPAVLDAAVGWEISDLAMAALDAGDQSGRQPHRVRLRTAAAVVRVGEDIRMNWTLELLPPLDTISPRPDSLWQAEQPDPRPSRLPGGGLSRREAHCLAGLSLLTLAILSYLGIQVVKMLGLTPPSAPPIIVPPEAISAWPTSLGRAPGGDLIAESSSRGPAPSANTNQRHARPADQTVRALRTEKSDARDNQHGEDHRTHRSRHHVDEPSTED